MEQTVKVAGQIALNVCGCGRLHLLCGPVTLHFEPLEFSAFAHAIEQLVVELQRHQAGMRTSGVPSQSPPVCH